MSARAASLALALASLVAASSVTAGLHEEVNADVERWKERPLLMERYKEPPADWHRVENTEYKISFALPCEPKLEHGRKAGMPILNYICTVDGHTYSLLVLAMGNPVAQGYTYDQWLSSIYLGIAPGAARRAAELNAQSTIGQEQRVLYQGMVGRQVALQARSDGIDAMTTMRFLAGSGITVTLMASCKSWQPTREVAQFLNSLRFL